MSNILFNLPTIILWMLVCMSVRTTLVFCDEKAAELSPESSDIKKLSVTESKVEESAQELKSKDGDTLDASPSQHTDYNYVVSKPQPISINLGSHTGSDQSLTTDHQISSQYDSQSQSAQQPPSQSIVYRYSTGADGMSSAEEPAQQQTYTRQESHQSYEPKSYIRQPLLGGIESSAAQPIGAGYRVPDLPNTKPGISTTYYSPNVKIVSHTRSFLPVVYNKPADESSEGSGQQSSPDQHEYDKAVQDRPGGSYGQQQQGDNYESNSQSDQDDNVGPAQNSYEKSNDYRNEEQESPEVLSRGPYYKIHKPHVAHIQVIEDKDQYNNDKKEEYGSGHSYGYRTQPRPQYKNYKPSGYQPGMLSSYDPPSPPLSSLLPSLPSQSLSSNEGESDNDDSYDGREQSGRSQHLPEAQPLQQLSQSPQEYKQRPGVEIEFDQGNKNEANVVRGPGLDRPQQYRRPNSYNDNSDDSDDGNDGQDYNQDRPNDSYESGNRGQDFINNNQLGPKYNSENDEQTGYSRGRPNHPQEPPHKPQSIEYGFIPLSEAKDISGGYRGPEGYRDQRERPNRPNRPNEGGFGPEGYRDQRGPPNGGGMRRPNGGMAQFMYGRGQGEGHRGGGYNGNDIYRDTPVGPSHTGLGPYRKPSFERPSFMKNSGEENNGYPMPPNSYQNGHKDDDEEVDGDEGDYGKQNNSNNSPDNNEDEVGPSDPSKLPYECYPWSCNPWHAIHPDSPYNSGIPLKGRGPYSGSGLPPGASYNPRDVGLDEGVIAQLNLAASSPQGISPGMVPPMGHSHGLRGGMAQGMDLPFAANRPLPNFNNVPGVPSQRPKPRPGMPFSASGQGFRSQYGYRAAASELSPVSAAQSSPTSANSPTSLSNLLNLNPVKSFRSLMSYLTGGLNE